MPFVLPAYATREAFVATLDAAPSAADLPRVDRALNTGSRAVETLCRRVFYPTRATRYFDRPDPGSSSPAWQLELGADEVTAVHTLTSGGTTIDGADILLEPNDLGPPYDRLTLDTSGSATFTSGDTWQRSVALLATYAGAPDVQDDAGELTAAVTDSVTTLPVDGAAAAAIGVGDLLLVDSERMLVTERAWSDTGTNVTLTADRTADSFAATGIAVGERLLVGSERMLVRDVTATTVIVRRAVDGTTLAAHTAADLYASRGLVVRRGRLGSTAATHADGATVAVQRWPALVSELALAEALVSFAGTTGGYTRPQGAGESTRPAPSGTIEDVRARCAAEHRRYRQDAI